MEIITELIKIDYPTLFIAVFIILMGIKTIISLVEWFVGKFGLETKWMRKKREEREQIILNTNAIKELSEKHEDSVKQSIRHDKMIQEDLSSLTNTVNGIADNLAIMQAKIDQTEMAKLKDQILSYYKKYKTIGEWDEFESDVFWGLYDSYISHGGNSFVKKDIEPIMRELNIKK